MGRWDLDVVSGRADRSLRHDQIFGYECLLPEWTYDMLLDHVFPEDRPDVAARFEAAIHGGSVCEFECRIQPPNQALRWIWARGRMRRDESGNAVSMLGILWDITDRKLAEQRLRTQMERLGLLDQVTRAIGERQDPRSIFQVAIRTLEDSLPIDFGCVCLYDAVAETLTVTCVGVRSSPLAMELAMEENALVDIDQSGMSGCVRGHLIYESDLSHVDFPFIRRLARAGLHAVVSAPLLVESQVFGILVVARRDAHGFSSGECEFLRQLSEHVALAAQQAQIYAALRQAYEDLRHTQQSAMQHERLRALGQMASGIAHDINNALSPVALYTEALLEREPNLSVRTREYLETTQRAIDDVAHTVGRMREFSRQREPQLVLAPVDLNLLVQQVLDLTRARWSDMPQQQGIVIRMETDLDPDLPVVSGVESEIREALTNLIFNAVDAMPSGGTLTLRTKAAGRASGKALSRRVHVQVEDTGVGMDEETRRRCLEPFFTTKGERGTGLGLAMVYGIAQRQNADLEMESEIGKGTTVRLNFPLPLASPVSPSLLANTSPTPNRLRILVVDDDPLIIKSLRDSLDADGHAVTTANGGQQGIDVLQAAEEDNERFSVVITDLGMPYVDGRKVANAAKKTSPATGVILLTELGSAVVGRRRHASERGSYSQQAAQAELVAHSPGGIDPNSAPATPC